MNHVFVNASPVINHDVFCLPGAITGGVSTGSSQAVPEVCAQKVLVLCALVCLICVCCGIVFIAAIAASIVIAVAPPLSLNGCGYV